jgi:quercetin dioxygenase-like cupin family protein
MVGRKRKKVEGAAAMHTIKTENNKSIGKELKPFVLPLPETGKHFEILSGNNSAVMHSGLVTLAKGECVGEHSTGEHEELIIILEGSGEIEAEGNGRKKIKQGETAYNPPNTKHNVYNTNDEELKYIYVVAKI